MSLIQEKEEEIIGLTFVPEWDDEEEVSVVIEGTLNKDSSMEMVMKDGDVIKDLELSRSRLLDLKYQIKKRNNGKLTLKWARFKDMQVKTLIRIKNVDDNYVIVIKDTK